MSNTQLSTIATLVSSKMNNIIGKVNEHTNQKANIDSPSFTGDVSIQNLGSDLVPSNNGLYNLGSLPKRYGKTYTEELYVSDNLKVTKESNSVIFRYTSSDTTITDSITITDGGKVKISDSYLLPSSDGTLGQVMATDGNGNVIFKTIENESADFAQYILSTDFTSDGSTTSYTVEATTLNKVLYVELNGLIQKKGTDYTVSGKVITFAEAPQSGMSGTIMFWGNDITSAVSTTDIVGNGSTSNYTTTDTLNKVILVEVNGLIQKKGVNYTVNVVNSRIEFTDPLPSGSTGTIVHV